MSKFARGVLAQKSMSPLRPLLSSINVIVSSFSCSVFNSAEVLYSVCWILTKCPIIPNYPFRESELTTETNKSSYKLLCVCHWIISWVSLCAVLVFVSVHISMHVFFESVHSYSSSLPLLIEQYTCTSTRPQFLPLQSCLCVECVSFVRVHSFIYLFFVCKCVWW